jgi:integrase/recombinase XerD
LHKQNDHNTTFMVTYKVLLDTRRAKADGTYAVQIRITSNRVSTTSNTGVFIEESYWNEAQLNVHATHPNAQLLNRKITESYLRGHFVGKYHLLKEKCH